MSCRRCGSSFVLPWKAGNTAGAAIWDSPAVFVLAYLLDDHSEGM